MCRLDYPKSTFVVARKQICQKGGIEYRGLAFQPLPFQQKGHTVKANRRNSLFPHYVPYGLRQFGHVRVCVLGTEVNGTVGVTHGEDRYGHRGEDTSVNSLLKKVTKVHDVYLFRLGVVPVYTGSGKDASPNKSPEIFARYRTRAGEMWGMYLKGLKGAMYPYIPCTPYVPAWYGIYPYVPYALYVPLCRGMYSMSVLTDMSSDPDVTNSLPRFLLNLGFRRRRTGSM